MFIGYNYINSIRVPLTIYIIIMEGGRNIYICFFALLISAGAAEGQVQTVRYGTVRYKLYEISVPDRLPDRYELIRYLVAGPR